MKKDKGRKDFSMQELSVRLRSNVKVFEELKTESQVHDELYERVTNETYEQIKNGSDKEKINEAWHRYNDAYDAHQRWLDHYDQKIKDLLKENTEIIDILRKKRKPGGK